MAIHSTSTERQPAVGAHVSGAAAQAGSVFHAAAETRGEPSTAPRDGRQAATLLYPMAGRLPPAKRLVVLVPDANVDEALLAARIWAVASPRALGVLYLGTLRQQQELYRARRRLAMLAAVTTDCYVHVEIALEHEHDWVEAVRSVWRPGDLIVCHDELTVAHGLRRQPASQALLQALNAPVYLLSGFYPDLPKERAHQWARIGVWIPPLAIIAAFFGLQTVLSQSMAAPLRIAALAIAVMVEFGLIAAWEHFLGNLQ